MSYPLALLQGSLILLVFSLGYLLLRRKSTFALQRLHLLAGLALSLLPFVWHQLPQLQPANAVRISLPVLDVTAGPADLSSTNAASRIDWLSKLYLTGALLSLLPALGSVLQLLRWLAGGRFEKRPQFTLVHTQGRPHGLCSFARWVFVPAGTALSPAFLLHEEGHVKLVHSADKLLLQLVATVFWFVPWVYWLRRELELLHELQADAYAVKELHPHTYATELSAYALGVPAQLLFNPLFKSKHQLLTRITMLNKQTLQNSKLAVAILSMSLLLSCAHSMVQGDGLSATSVDLETETTHEAVEVMPEYPGGMDALLNYMGTAVKYPASAKKDSVEGIVIIQFVVTRLGDVAEAQILRGIHPDIDLEALRAVRAMPKWTPGKIKGKAVNVQYNLPFRFVLSSDKAE